MPPDGYENSPPIFGGMSGYPSLSLSLWILVCARDLSRPRATVRAAGVKRIARISDVQRSKLRHSSIRGRRRIPRPSLRSTGRFYGMSPKPEARRSVGNNISLCAAPTAQR
jgi:hypothetical protein